VSEVEGTLEDLIEDIGGVDYSNIGELEEVLDELGIAYTSNYLRMSTRGYSQGDYAEILVNIAEYKKIVGAEFEEDEYQKWFDHYFWDSPIYGTIEVSFQYTRNSVNLQVYEELHFDEYTNDRYEVNLNIDEIIKSIETPYPLTGDEVSQLKEALGNIDYTDVKYPCAC
jgi:hypothetical protein